MAGPEGDGPRIVRRVQHGGIPAFELDALARDYVVREGGALEVVVAHLQALGEGGRGGDVGAAAAVDELHAALDGVLAAARAVAGGDAAAGGGQRHAEGGGGDGIDGGGDHVVGEDRGCGDEVREGDAGDDGGGGVHRGGRGHDRGGRRRSGRGDGDGGARGGRCGGRVGDSEAGARAGIARRAGAGRSVRRD